VTSDYLTASIRYPELDQRTPFISAYVGTIQQAHRNLSPKTKVEGSNYIVKTTKPITAHAKK